MGIASPALFAAVLADGGEGREGRSTSSIPLTRQVGSGTGAAVAGIVFAATLTARQIARPSTRAHTCPPSSTPLRLTYLAVAAVSASASSPACGCAATWRPRAGRGRGRRRAWPSSVAEAAAEPAVRGTG